MSRRSLRKRSTSHSEIEVGEKVPSTQPVKRTRYSRRLSNSISNDDLNPNSVARSSRRLSADAVVLQTSEPLRSSIPVVRRSSRRRKTRFSEGDWEDPLNFESVREEIMFQQPISYRVPGVRLSQSNGTVDLRNSNIDLTLDSSDDEKEVSNKRTIISISNNAASQGHSFVTGQVVMTKYGLGTIQKILANKVEEVALGNSSSSTDVVLVKKIVSKSENDSGARVNTTDDQTTGVSTSCTVEEAGPATSQVSHTTALPQAESAQAADLSQSADPSQPESIQTADPSQPESTQTADPSQPESTQTADPSQPESTQTADPSPPESTQTTDPSQPESTQTTDPSQPESTQTADPSQPERVPAAKSSPPTTSKTTDLTQHSSPVVVTTTPSVRYEVWLQWGDGGRYVPKLKPQSNDPKSHSKDIGLEFQSQQQAFKLYCTPDQLYHVEGKVMHEMRVDSKPYTLTFNDFARLWPGSYLNDALVNYHLALLLEKLPKNDRASIHRFTSYFFTKLFTALDLNGLANIHNGIAQWTRKVDLFSKDFVIVPIVHSQHWSLAVVCFPGALGKVCSRSEPVVDAETPEVTIFKPGAEKQGTIDKNNGQQCSLVSSDCGSVAASRETAGPAHEKETEGDVNREQLNRKNSNDGEVDELANNSSSNENVISRQVEQDGTSETQQDMEVEQLDINLNEKHQVNDSKSDQIPDEMANNSALSDANDNFGSKETFVEITCSKCSRPKRTHRTRCSYCTHKRAKVAKEQATKEQEEYKGVRPCIIFMDSLKGHRVQKITRLLRNYFQCEWNKRKGDSIVVTAASLPVCSPIVPLQSNSCDCGVFVLEYAERLLQNLDQIRKVLDTRNRASTSGQTSFALEVRAALNKHFGPKWFPETQVAMKRNEMLRAIKSSFSEAQMKEKNRLLSLQKKKQHK